jgi:hypothetical protein
LKYGGDEADLESWYWRTFEAHPTFSTKRAIPDLFLTGNSFLEFIFLD